MLSKQLGVIWLLLLLCSSTLAQFTFKGKVLDDKSKQPLAFVNILTDRNYGATTDIDGNFIFKTSTPVISLKLSYVGYEPKEIQVDNKDYIIVELIPTTFQLQEVRILPGENPAHRIIKKVVDNRTQLNPEKSMDFTYDSYSKLYVTAEMDSALLNNPEKLAKADSITQRTDSILKTQ
ncbi:MAG: carboxypeptidase-like regulatory domain-containing protein, partial [Flavobacteriales bacterium]|nr:carboxypeptidase-like regulatory domain-containing protein [Flavobacteriales bacterium]